MRITPAIGLINTAALLVALGVSLDLVLRRRRSSELWALISTGVALGAIGVVSMMNHWSFGSVITSDSRPSVILSLGGLFFGPVPTVIAVTIIGVFRVYIGGAGIWVGLGVILTSGAIGLLWRYYRRTRLGEISRIELLSFGLVVHTGTILCMFSLSAEHVNGVISNMSFPLLIIYPAATVLLGSLLSDQLAYRQVQKALEESEEKYRLLADGAMEGIIVIQDGVLRFVNPRAAQMVGYAELELLDTPFVNFIYPDDRETILSQNYQQLKGESLPSRRSIRFLTRDGAQKFVEIDSGMITWDKRPAILAFLKDITERVTIEKALRESEERYRTVADFTYDWECWVDCQGNFLYVSPSCERITGYTAREFIDDPDLMNRIIHPDDRTQMLHHACDVRRVIPHTVDANDFRIIRRDGETRWIGHVCQPVYGQEGQPLGKRCSNRDITERKRAEEELRRSESRLRRAELVAGFGNWELDLSTRRVTTSNGARQIYGLGRQVEWTFDHIKKFSLPEYRSQLDEALLALIKNGAPYDIEFEIRRANDNQVINIHSIAHHDSEKDLVFGTIHDITNLRRAEQSRRLLFTAIEQAAEGIIITDAAGIIQYVNPAQEILSGYSRNELLGQTPGIFKSDERDDNFHSNLWETIKAGKVWTGRFVNKKKAGTKYHEAATVSPVYDKSGNLTNFVVVEHDVTTQLQLQEQLFQAQKMEAIGTLAGGFAHDFNNKLQVIAGYVELILLKKDLPETLKQDLGVIRQTTDSSAELIRRMMVFSRKTPIELQPIELNKLVTQASSMLGRSIPKMIEMDVLLADDLWTINGDKIQIEQILMNLVINARDAMPDGGKLTIQTQNTVLSEEFCRSYPILKPGEYVLIRLSDTGTGMDKETLSHIFEPFFTTKEPGEGTGLGLAVVYTIVEQHGGMIICDSEPSVGTTFRIYFPAIEEVPPEQYSEKKEAPRGRGETILVVDDDPNVTEFSFRMLTEAHYSVMTASNGKDALELYETHREEIKLVILNLAMPQMDGRECLLALRRMDPKIRILVASGALKEGMEEDLKETGAKGVIRKPFNMSLLLEKIQKIIYED